MTDATTVAPAELAQVKVKVESALRDAVVLEPAVAAAPAQAPEAVQEAAFVEDHVRLELPPDVTLTGLAVISAVGAAAVVGLLAGVGFAVAVVGLVGVTAEEGVFAVAEAALLPEPPQAASDAASAPTKMLRRPAAIGLAPDGHDSSRDLCATRTLPLASVGRS